MDPKRSCIKNAKTKRCNKTANKNVRHSDCVYFKRTRRCRTVKVIKNIIKDYYGYPIRKSAKDYLNRLIIKRPADKFRAISKEHGLGLSLEDYTDDIKLHDFLIDEILELAHNFAREREETTVISVKAIKWVIKNDEELKIVLKK